MRKLPVQLPKLNRSRRQSTPVKSASSGLGKRFEVPGQLPGITSSPMLFLPLKANGVIELEAGGFRALPDALTRYLQDAAEVPLITPQQENELAARIKCGDHLAREHMIRANLRFVIKIARDYENLGMPLLDLINEGNIGLMKAVERFDPAKGAKLSTYAVLWIKQQIRRALASQGKTIRLPVHIADKIYQLTQAEVRLRGELGRDASDEELADVLGIKPSRIAKLRRAALRPSSLDAPIGDEKNSTVSELMPDENALSPFDQLLNNSEIELVRQLVDKLPPREARIIRFRFGLDSGTERTLEDVGRRFRLTRERIRQLQNIALVKLRQMMDQPAVHAAAA